MNVQKSPQIHTQSVIISSDFQNTAKTVFNFFIKLQKTFLFVKQIRKMIQFFVEILKLVKWF